MIYKYTCKSCNAPVTDLVPLDTQREPCPFCRAYELSFEGTQSDDEDNGN